MGVASGITVNASAEWASLLPFADGGHQIVRGLTLPPGHPGHAHAKPNCISDRNYISKHTKQEFTIRKHL